MGLLFWGVDLQPCKTMTDTLAPVERANWVQPAWNSSLDWNGVPSVWLGGQDHLRATGGPVSLPGGFSSSLSTPPTHPLVTLDLN